MENILDRNNSAHIRSYEGIRDIIFKRKTGKNQQRNTPNSGANHKVQQPKNNIPSNQNNAMPQPKKGKSKFKDINTYQVKKKQKEGSIRISRIEITFIDMFYL